MERLNKKLQEKGEHSLLDAGDDCYLAYSLGIGDTHGHPACTDVFSPTKKVSFALKHKLWAKLIEMALVYGHDLPHSFLMQHANDEKLNEEILTGIEKMANKDTLDFWPYAMKARITKMTKILGFSEKQVQWLLKAADKFEQLHKKKLSKED